MDKKIKTKKVKKTQFEIVQECLEKARRRLSDKRFHDASDMYEKAIELDRNNGSG